MFTSTPPLLANAVDFGAQDRALTAQEAADVAALLAGNDYKGLTIPEKILKACLPFEIPNPDPPTLVDRTGSLPMSEFLRLIGGKPDAKGDSLSSEIQSLAGSDGHPLQRTCSDLLLMIQTLTHFEFGKQERALLAELEAAGVMTQAVADEVLRMPDPDYQAILRMDPPIQAILGAGAVLTVRDVEGL